MSAFVRETFFKIADQEVDLGDLAWSRDGRSIAVLSSLLRVARVFAAADGSEIARVDDLSSMTRTIGFSADNRVIIPPRNSPTSAVGVWDFTRGTIDHVIGPQPDIADERLNALGQFAISSDGSKLAGLVQTGRGPLSTAFYDARAWRLIGGGTLGGLRIDISPDGSHAAIGESSGAVTVLDIATSAQRARFKAHVTQVRTLRWSAEGRRIATAGAFDGVAPDPVTGVRRLLQEPRPLQIWDARNGVALNWLREVRSAQSIDFSSDGALLAATTGAGELLTWDARDFASPEIIASGLPRGTALTRFSPDGSRLALAITATGVIVIFSRTAR